MSAAAIAKRLADAGLDASAIVAALEAFEAVEETRKAKTRERKRRQRAKEAVTERDVTGQDVTNRDLPFPPSFPPTPPLSPTHTHVDITTRAKDDGFSAFWTAYPNKKSKPQAAKAFAKAVRKVSVGVMLEAVSRQRLWPSWIEGYVPHASTWLNNERWADEPDLERKIRPNDRTRTSAKSEHLERVARAMAASVGGEFGECERDTPEPGFEGGSVPRLTVVGGHG